MSGQNALCAALLRHINADGGQNALCAALLRSINADGPGCCRSWLHGVQAEQTSEPSTDLEACDVSGVTDMANSTSEMGDLDNNMAEVVGRKKSTAVGCCFCVACGDCCVRVCLVDLTTPV